MKMTTQAALMAGALILPMASIGFAQDAPTGTYGFDPDHSAITFEYNHMGFSTSPGLIRGVVGVITLDAENPDNSSVEASFPISQILTVAADLDKHMLGEDMFNSPDASQMVMFKSTKVDVDDDKDEAKVTGDLTLNGVTKSVVLDVELEKAGIHPMTNKPTLGFEAETEILRSDFNLGLFAPAVSDKVKIELFIEAGLTD